METIIIAYIREVFNQRVNETISFFKKHSIEIINIKFDYTKYPYECVIKTRDKK